MLSDQCPDTSEMAHQLENGQLDFRLPIFIFCIVSVKIAWLRMMLVVLCCRIEALFSFPVRVCAIIERSKFGTPLMLGISGGGLGCCFQSVLL